VIHRDLKPTNIFLVQGEREPVVKVMDFGISKVLGAPTTLTADMAVLGSPRYMAPEQALGRSAEVDARADVFALGVIAFEMLAGAPPFMGDSVPETLFKVVYDEPATPPGWRSVPASLQRVVLRCLSKDPGGRPGSMAELWRELVAALEAMGLSAGAPSADATPRRAPSRVRPRRRRWAVAGGVALAAVGVAAFGYFHLRPVRAPAGSPSWPDTRAAARSGADGAPDATRGHRPPDAAGGPDAPATRQPGPRRARRTGCLLIQSKEETGEHLWANTSVDRRRVGQTPLRLRQIRTGWRTIQVSRPGYRTVRRRVLVAPGRCTTATFTLRATSRSGQAR
jgi:serine/threonine-protein kinase